MLYFLSSYLSSHLIFAGPLGNQLQTLFHQNHYCSTTASNVQFPNWPIITIFLTVVEFELRVSHLVGRQSATRAMPPTLFSDIHAANITHQLLLCLFGLFISNCLLLFKKYIVFLNSSGWLSFRESHTQICLILSSWCHLTCLSIFGNSYKVKVRSSLD
jgi:hypothetical protein